MARGSARANNLSGIVQAVGTAAAPPAPPQVSANQKGAIRAAVNLVEVDIAVTDRDGKPLKGLRQDQFSIAEDGKDQRISTFDYYDVERLETAGAGDSTPITIPIGSLAPAEEVRQQIRDRRMIVLFFDLTSLQPNDLTRSTLAAKQFLTKQMTPADLVGVVAFGNQLRVIADFTNDRDLLYNAVDALLPGKESQLAALAAACHGDSRPDCPILSDMAGAHPTHHPTQIIAKVTQRFAGGPPFR